MIETFWTKTPELNLLDIDTNFPKPSSSFSNVRRTLFYDHFSGAIFVNFMIIPTTSFCDEK